MWMGLGWVEWWSSRYFTGHFAPHLEKHAIVHPRGRSMGWMLWVHSLTDLLPILFCWVTYNVILDRNIPSIYNIRTALTLSFSMIYHVALHTWNTRLIKLMNRRLPSVFLLSYRHYHKTYRPWLIIPESNHVWSYSEKVAFPSTHNFVIYHIFYLFLI